MKKRVRFKGNKVIQVAFSEEEFQKITKMAKDMNVAKYEVIRELMLTSNKLN